MPDDEHQEDCLCDMCLEQQQADYEEDCAAAQDEYERQQQGED